MYYRMSAVFVLSISGVLLAEEPTTKALGRNFGLIANMIGRANSTPSDLLQDEGIQVELGLSEQQLADLKRLNVGVSTFPEVFALSGLNQNEDQETSAVDIAARDFRQQQSDLETLVQKVLTPKQYQRMKQIFNQKTLMSGNPDQVAEGFGADRQEVAKLKSSVYESNAALAVQIQKIKWRLYLKAFDDVLGEGTSRKAFGKPFYLDVEFDESEHENANRRRDR